MSASTAVDLPALDLPAGLFGFPDAHRFALVEWGEPGLGLFLLRCLDTEGLEFLVAAPHALFPDYAPEIPDADADRLGLTDASDALLLVIVTLPDRVQDATANLLAPVVVNARTRRAEQIVLDGDSYSMKALLTRS